MIKWPADSRLHGHLPENACCVREMLPNLTRWGSLHGYRFMSQTSKPSFTPAQKAEIIRKHFGGKEPVLNLAAKFGV